ncbi:MAG: CysB family HTH-type transcriptional regulator [Limnobacter sp.]|uniref:CysB family HTH-type transcriptional regulator n=1 Tax=Limnobacter sp. TaxID=2003368 RepID=UPI0022BFC00D|nr:CysB family HTH-type transcriptional regulator [Limnobacter sp.]MCZ8016701.1 CysB family HTH-type transcriptional regulator [Limnobacter sp.]
MNLHQLRFVREAVRHDFSLTDAAKALFTSQPGVSKAIIEFEEELGFQIFKRHGKRIKGLTPPGELVYQACERVLAEMENIKRVGEEFAARESGQLTVAVTHTQARYVLPQAVAVFRKKFPKVKLILLQGTPEQLAQWVRKDQADLAVATEALADEPDLVTFPCYDWGHVAVAPVDSPLLKEFAQDKRKIALADFDNMPVITYETHFAGRKKIDAAFQKAGVTIDLVLEAIDADVIKTYVGLGLGVGIIAEVAFDAEKDKGLVAVPVDHLFGRNTTRIALRQGVFMRTLMYEFIAVFAPMLTPKLIDRVLDGGQAYDI